MIQYNVEKDWRGRFRIGAYRVTRQSESQSTSTFLHHLKDDTGNFLTFPTEERAQKLIDEQGILAHIHGETDEASGDAAR
jgi:hypothetical protein